MKRKKIIPIVAAIFALLLAGGLLTILVLITKQMQVMNNQLLYLQDTTDIIQADLGSLQFDIQKTLEEENSMVESYSIDVIDTDFASDSYTVNVEVIPKEYTDNTKAKVFFGTSEYSLSLKGYTYQGTFNLSTKETYDGNVTFLFQNGEKKSTEVLQNYVGFISEFENVLQGNLLEIPKYEQNILKIKDNLEYNLDGAGRFVFSSCMCIVEANGEPILEQELLQGEIDEEGTVDFFQGMGADEEIVSTEVSAAEPVVMEPVEGMSGSYDLSLEQEILPDTEIKVYLKAISTEGYVFFYDLLKGRTAQEEGFTEEQAFAGNAFVADQKGGILEIVAE